MKSVSEIMTRKQTASAVGHSASAGLYSLWRANTMEQGRNFILLYRSHVYEGGGGGSAFEVI